MKKYFYILSTAIALTVSSIVPIGVYNIGPWSYAVVFGLGCYLGYKLYESLYVKPDK